MNKGPRKLSVQLQTVSACNATCAMCPYMESWQKKNPGKMSEELFDSIIEQLKTQNLEKLCLYLENEPLLDKRIFDWLKKARKELNFKQVEISTNASILPAEKAEILAKTLDDIPHTIWISFHGVDKQSYEQVMGLDFDQSLENVVRLLKLSQTYNLKIMIRGAGSAMKEGQNRSPHHFTREQMTEFWEGVFKEHDIKRRPRLNYFRYHDRAGSNKRNEYNFDVRKRSLLGFYCNRVDEWLHVLYNGDVVLCCNDYHRRTLIGNLNEQTVSELLVNPTYRKYRLMLLGLKKSPDSFICKSCAKPNG